MKLKSLFLAVIAVFPIATPCSAQLTQAAGTILRGKNILDFYEAAVSNPQQIIILSAQIRILFYNSQTRYKDLSNALVQNMKWFDAGPLGLEHIELNSEPSPGYQYGYFSITLKKLNFKQCEILSNYGAVNQNFSQVELNGTPIFQNGGAQQPVALCQSQWFFQDGKNEIKYIGY